MSNKRLGKQKGRIFAPQDPLTDADEGLEPRVRGSKWSWLATSLKVLVGAALIAATVAGLSWGVYHYARTTPRFSVRKLEIEGTKRLSREDVLNTAAIALGDNLFSIEVEKAEAALVVSPWIQSARVTRRLPDSVRLEIHEREARAIMVMEGRSFLVDADGEAFKELGGGDPHDLPLITGVAADDFAGDRRMEIERLRDVLGLLRSYERLSLGREYPAEEVHLDPSGSATLTVGMSGTALHLGTAPWKQKLLRAERVLSKSKRRGAAPSVVFLDNEAHPERVVVRVQ